jgi:hypothetical protein
MTLSFPEDLIFGGGQWRMSLRFNIRTFNPADHGTRQEFMVKETTSSPTSTLEFYTYDDEAYSVLL